MKQKTKILCVCAKGLNRSKYIAEYLRRKGYSTKYGGLEPLIFNELDITNYLNQKKVDWADIIIVVRKRLVGILKKNFKTKNKKIISFDITDSKRLISEEKPEYKNLTKEQMNKLITYPRLRKQINSLIEKGRLK